MLTPRRAVYVRSPLDPGHVSVEWIVSIGDTRWSADRWARLLNVELAGTDSLWTAFDAESGLGLGLYVGPQWTNAAGSVFGSVLFEVGGAGTESVTILLADGPKSAEVKAREHSKTVLFSLDCEAAWLGVLV